MEQNQILEGNKLIAEFMNDDVVIEISIGFGGRKGTDTVHHSKVTDWNKTKMHYYSSWDRLMPIIKKILDTTFEEGSPFVQDDYNAVVDNIPDIEATWRAVVEFVKTFNLEVYGK